MSKTNCCNCGAAINVWQPHCEFCGTKNVNLTALDLGSGEPANFIFKMPSNMRVVDKDGTDVYLSLLAIPSLETMEMKVEKDIVYSGWDDSRPRKYSHSHGLELQLKLDAVSRIKQNNDKDTLYTLTIGEQ